MCDGKFEDDPPEKSRCSARIATGYVIKSVPLYENMIHVSFGLLSRIFRLTFSLKKNICIFVFWLINYPFPDGIF